MEMAKRNYIFNTIRDVFHLFGYQQIETPSMENLSTLMGKYGDEGDKLLFKIQNSGDYFSGITDEELLSRNAVKLASKFCEKDYAMISLYRSPVTWSCTVTKSVSLSSVIKFSRFGVRTVLRRAVIVNSISVMPMW